MAVFSTSAFSCYLVFLQKCADITDNVVLSHRGTSAYSFIDLYSLTLVLYKTLTGIMRLACFCIRSTSGYGKIQN